MSRKKREKGGEFAPTAETAAPVLVYCGPSIKGTAKQYTVYSAGLTDEMKAFLKKHPTAAALTVPIERFAEVRKSIGTNETAENILFKKLKAETEEEKKHGI